MRPSFFVIHVLAFALPIEFDFVVATSYPATALGSDATGAKGGEPPRLVSKNDPATREDILRKFAILARLDPAGRKQRPDAGADEPSGQVDQAARYEAQNAQTTAKKISGSAAAGNPPQASSATAVAAAAGNKTPRSVEPKKSPAAPLAMSSSTTTSSRDRDDMRPAPRRQDRGRLSGKSRHDDDDDDDEGNSARPRAEEAETGNRAIVIPATEAGLREPAGSNDVSADDRRRRSSGGGLLEAENGYGAQQLVDAAAGKRPTGRRRDGNEAKRSSRVRKWSFPFRRERRVLDADRATREGSSPAAHFWAAAGEAGRRDGIVANPFRDRRSIRKNGRLPGIMFPPMMISNSAESSYLAPEKRMYSSDYGEEEGSFPALLNAEDPAESVHLLAPDGPPPPSPLSSVDNLLADYPEDLLTLVLVLKEAVADGSVEDLLQKHPWLLPYATPEVLGLILEATVGSNVAGIVRGDSDLGAGIDDEDEDPLMTANGGDEDPPSRDAFGEAQRGRLTEAPGVDAALGGFRVPSAPLSELLLDGDDPRRSPALAPRTRAGSRFAANEGDLSSWHQGGEESPFTSGRLPSVNLDADDAARNAKTYVNSDGVLVETSRGGRDGILSPQLGPAGADIFWKRGLAARNDGGGSSSRNPHLLTANEIQSVLRAMADAAGSKYMTRESLLGNFPSKTQQEKQRFELGPVVLLPKSSRQYSTDSGLDDRLHYGDRGGGEPSPAASFERNSYRRNEGKGKSAAATAALGGQTWITPPSGTGGSSSSSSSFPSFLTGPTAFSKRHH